MRSKFLLFISYPGYDTTHYIIPSIWYPIYGTFLMFTTGEGNGNPLQYSCLENPVDRRAWWAAVHSVAQSRTWLKRLSMHACIGEGDDNPLQWSCLENSKGRGAWWAAVYGVAQSRTWLKWLSMHVCIRWRRKWQPTPVVVPGEFQGQRSLVGCHLWGRTELDMSEVT